MSVFGGTRRPRGRYDSRIVTPGFGVGPMQNGGTISHEFAEKMAKNRRSMGAGANCKRWQSLSRLSVGRPRGRHYFRINLEGCLWCNFRDEPRGSRRGPRGPRDWAEKAPSRVGHQQQHWERDPRAPRSDLETAASSVTSEHLARKNLMSYVYLVPNTQHQWHLLCREEHICRRARSSFTTATRENGNKIRGYKSPTK